MSEWPHLVGDVGGTNARFALVYSEGAAASDIILLSSPDYPDLASAVEAYLSMVGVRPSVACIAVAGPVSGDRVVLTNVAWDFSVEATRLRLHMARLLVVNDFLALAMAVPGLHKGELCPLGDEQATAADDPVDQHGAKGPIAVVGPGTGLGVAAVIPRRQAGQLTWTALATEGGHVGLAPETDRERALLEQLRTQPTDGGLSHVSAEMLLSGPGLERLHETMLKLGGHVAEPLHAAEIMRRGLTGSDPMCAVSLELFAGLLGSFAGNVALTLGARGGVFIGGGVARRLGSFLANSSFRARFEAKGVMGSYLRSIPTSLIMAEQPTFAGAARLLLV